MAMIPGQWIYIIINYYPAPIETGPVLLQLNSHALAFPITTGKFSPRRSAVDRVAQAIELIHFLLFDIGFDGFEGEVVAVDVGEDGDAHGKCSKA
jgi:hypothetical protein